jgi:hypothetical protein
MNEPTLTPYPTVIPVKPKAQSRGRRKSLFLHFLSVACVTLLYFTVDSPSMVLILGGSLMFVTYLILGLQESRREPVWFTPLSFYFYWYTVGFGLSAIYMGITLLSEDHISFSVKEVPAKDMATGYIIYLIGSLALHLGMQISRPVQVAKEMPNHWQGRNNYLTLIGILWAVGILAKWKPNWFAALGALGGPMQWLAIASICCLALTPLTKLKISKPIFAGLLIVGVAGLAFASLESNSKAVLMFSFFPIIWLFLLNPSLRKWLPPIVIALAILYFALVAPLIMSSRKEQLLEGETASERAIRTFQSGNFANTQNPNSDEEGQVASFLSRQFDPTPVGFLVGEVREYGLQMGETMDYIAYAFVPRIIWPDKPNVTRGAWFTAYLGFAAYEDEATTSTGITATGELYWNFGIAGVVSGMFLLGVLISGLWRMAGCDPRNKPFHMILFCMIMLNMADMPEAVTVFVSIVVNFLIFQTLFFLIGKSASNKQRRKQVAIASTITSR